MHSKQHLAIQCREFKTNGILRQVMIVVGGAFERGNMVPSLIFSFCWATVVYCPLACWTWNSNGWLYNLPSLDFAGGGPVHIASGWSALAYAFVLGKRKNIDRPSQAKPHNTTLVFLGTVLIWFGWFGFNVCHTCAFFSKLKSDSSYFLGRLCSQCQRAGNASGI